MTLADFLISRPLTLDVEIDEECSGAFPVKGTEFDAAVLYLGLNEFRNGSADLSPPEMLVFQNMFISWVRHSFEGIRCSVVEKLQGNSMLLLFSASTGSGDPFIDALRTARWLGENDSLKFSPVAGIARGTVLAGFAGGSTFVYGTPVFLAAACAKLNTGVDAAAAVTFPAEEWKEWSLDEVFPPVEYDHPVKGRIRQPSTWKLGEPGNVDVPGYGRLMLRDIANFIHWMPSVSASDKAREWVRLIRSRGLYRNPR